MEVSVLEQREVIKCVIYSVCIHMTKKEIRENINGGEVVEVNRLKACEGGNLSAPVLITFKGVFSWQGCSLVVCRTRLGPIRPSLRCFKCQLFGHMSAACRGDKRCAKCGGSHDIVDCEDLVPKCCYCGGSRQRSVLF